MDLYRVSVLKYYWSSPRTSGLTSRKFYQTSISLMCAHSFIFAWSTTSLALSAWSAINSGNTYTGATGGRWSSRTSFKSRGERDSTGPHSSARKTSSSWSRNI